MIHGHYFNFINEAELSSDLSESSSKNITVKRLTDPAFLTPYTLKQPWVPLSGQEGRYFSKKPFERADENFSWGLDIKDVLTLIWEPKEQTIYYKVEKHYTAERLRFWIYHTFFPLVLDLSRKYAMLHVGAIEIDSKPILFSAASFGGKSTLTDYFIQKGHTLLSDDTLGIEKKETSYFAIPSFPFYRPFREPETLGYPAKNFAIEAKPLHAVLILKKSKADAEVKITRLKGIEKFKAFHCSTFVDLSFRKQERFAFFTEMAQHVPVYTITIPWDLNRLEEVYQAIVNVNLP